MLAYLRIGDRSGMPALLSQLVEMQYDRTNLDLARGTFRVTRHVLDVRPRDDQGTGLLQRHRELFPTPLGAPARRASADSDRLLPEGFPPRRGRVPRDAAPGPGHVPRRPFAQGSLGRVRIPPSVGPG